MCVSQAPDLFFPPHVSPLVNELIYKAETDLQIKKKNRNNLSEASITSLFKTILWICSNSFGDLCPPAMSCPSWTITRITSTHPFRHWKHIFAPHSSARLYQIATLFHSLCVCCRTHCLDCNCACLHNKADDSLRTEVYFTPVT